MLAKLLKSGSKSAEPGFTVQFVRWVVVCSEQGQYLGVTELGDPGPKNPGMRFDSCPYLTQPEIASGRKGEWRRHFLVDRVEVVSGRAQSPNDQTKVEGQHRYFRGLIEEASTSIGRLKPVARMLADESAMDDLRRDLEAHKAKPTDWATFRVGNEYPVRWEDCHTWWVQKRKNLLGSADVQTTPRRISLLSGEPVQPCKTHPKVKGLAPVGGQAMGDVLIGFDKPAFESYGLRQSENAAMSEDEATQYVEELNEKIRSRGRVLAGAKVVIWYDGEVPDEDDPLAWLVTGSDQQERDALRRAAELLSAVRDGRRPDLGRNRYVALTLSGMSGRVMVRDWMEGAFEGLVANVKIWFDDLSIVNPDGTRMESCPKFEDVVGALERDSDGRRRERDRDALSAPLVVRMWRAALQGEEVPLFAVARVLARFRSDIVGTDGPFNVAREKHRLKLKVSTRMGLLKAYHIRKARKEGGENMARQVQPILNEEHPHPAYHCGRLLAILAVLQKRALGNVGAGVVQRYYSAASVTPALVLGRLIRTSQFHLSKVKGSHWYEERISAVLGRIGDSVPRVLTLEEQSLFALGYYQQWAEMQRRTEKEDVENTSEKEEKHE